MAWPQATDYAEAVQNLALAFRDREIQTGRAVTTALGLPVTRTGNFAAVFEVASSTNRHKWAVKCFTRHVPGLEDRYHHIDVHLRQFRASFMVRFQYLPRSVLVQERWYPLLKMDWVDGLRLDDFIARCLSRRNYKPPLRTLCGMWERLAQMLREAEVGHGDLQHGNVLLVPVADRDAYKLRLVDYDGMYVPSLAGNPSTEVGHAAYQHPQRLAQGGYGPEIDRFSHLVIYTTLRCLIAAGPRLWDEYYDGDRLLIGQEDLEAPDKSPAFGRLWQLPDPAARHLVGHLILAARGPLEQVPSLDDLVVYSEVVPLTGARRREVEQLMSGSPVSAAVTGATTLDVLSPLQDVSDTDSLLATELPAAEPLSAAPNEVAPSGPADDIQSRVAELLRRNRRPRRSKGAPISETLAPARRRRRSAATAAPQEPPRRRRCPHCGSPLGSDPSICEACFLPIDGTSENPFRQADVGVPYRIRGMWLEIGRLLPWMILAVLGLILLAGLFYLPGGWAFLSGTALGFLVTVALVLWLIAER